MRSARLAPILGLAALLPALPILAQEGGANAVEDDHAEHWRLFVADQASPLIRAIDLEDGRVVGTFSVEAPASLYVSPSQRLVYAVQSGADRVSIIDTGVVFDDHGDHADLHVEAPSIFGFAFEGGTPIHFVMHDGFAVPFFDDEGVAWIVKEEEVLQGAAAPRRVESGAPHHGVAATLGDMVLISAPNAENPDALPVGIRVIDASGNQVGDTQSCPDLHGEAASGSLMAFACGTGVLLFERGSSTATFLPYPAGLPAERIGTLLGGTGLQYFVGNFGADGVVVVEPDTGAFNYVQLPTRRVTFATDPERSNFVYLFTEDGQLRRLNVVTGELDRSLALTGAYSVDGDFADPRPRIAVAGDMIVVTDPLAGVLRLVDATTFEPAGQLAVDGVPFGIVAAGGHGAAH